jgi:hypothetical protein
VLIGARTGYTGAGQPVLLAAESKKTDCSMPFRSENCALTAQLSRWILKKLAWSNDSR